MSDNDSAISFLCIILLWTLVPISIAVGNNYEKEVTIQVVSVEKVRSYTWWPHTTIRYTDIQLNAVTELETRSEIFFGTYHDLEPGHIYHIKYRMQWNWWYPQIESIIDVTQDYTEKR